VLVELEAAVVTAANPSIAPPVVLLALAAVPVAAAVLTVLVVETLDRVGFWAPQGCS
jgi:hypothetical protein